MMVTPEIKELFIRVGAGSPSAITLVLALYEKYGVQDVETLDVLGIRGHNVWDLYKHECGENLDRLHQKLLDKRKMIEWLNTPAEYFSVEDAIAHMLNRVYIVKDEEEE